MHRVGVLAGVLLGGLAGALLVAPGALGAGWGAGVEVTPPPNAGANPRARLISVSCASAGNCSAVGDYLDDSGNQQGLLLTKTSGTWAAGVQASLPANAGANPAVQLISVSCASAGNCSAVGMYFDSAGHSQGLLLTETSGAWAAGVQASLPVDAGSNQDVRLTSVSCASTGYCSAVGTYLDSSGHSQGLLLTETSGTWVGGLEATPPAGAGATPDVWLSSVSCASAGNCSAVGNYVDSLGHGQGLLLTETSGTWASGLEAKLPANALSDPDPLVLSSVSCASAGNCSAVGSYTPGGGLLLTETAGTWARGVEAALPAGGLPGLVVMGSVSCASAGNCSAVGSYQDGSGLASWDSHALLLTETSGTWAGGVGEWAGVFAGGETVSCTSAGNCSAVGTYYDSAGNTQGWSLTETSGTWAGGAEVTPPANAASNPNVFLLSVSCASASDCTAVGSYRDRAGNVQGLLVTESVRPELSAFGASPHKLSLTGRKAGRRCLEPTSQNNSHRRCRLPLKLGVSYTLNMAAIVVFTLKQQVAGREVNGRCVMPTRKNATHRKCTRVITVHGKIVQNGQAGTNRFTFTGKIAGRTLGPGSYQLTATPRAAGNTGAPESVKFTLVA